VNSLKYLEKIYLFIHLKLKKKLRIAQKKPMRLLKKD